MLKAIVRVLAILVSVSSHSAWASSTRDFLVLGKKGDVAFLDLESTNTEWVARPDLYRGDVMEEAVWGLDDDLGTPTLFVQTSDTHECFVLAPFSGDPQFRSFDTPADVDGFRNGLLYDKKNKGVVAKLWRKAEPEAGRPRSVMEEERTIKRAGNVNPDTRDLLFVRTQMLPGGRISTDSMKDLFPNASESIGQAVGKLIGWCLLRRPEFM